MEKLPFTRLTPNEHGDWISKRNDKFGNWIPIEAEKKGDVKSQSWFTTYSLGCATNRDVWVYNYSIQKLSSNVDKTINHYNDQRIKLEKGLINEIEKNATLGNWTRDWLNAIQRNRPFSKKDDLFTLSNYRPYCKQNYYFDDDLNQERYKQPELFPTSQTKNLLICVTGIGSTKLFSTLISDKIPCLDYVEKSQCFPLYWYETINPNQSSLFGDDAQIVRHEAISDFILERAQSKYGNKVQKEDIFYYVYGILYSKSYRETFEADLKKMLPRIPLVSDFQKFWDFSKAGRELANLHLNYEKIAAYPDVEVESLKMVHYESPKTMYDIDDGTPMAAETARKHSSSKDDDYEYYAVQ